MSADQHSNAAALLRSRDRAADLMWVAQQR
jgi:hypothetical protein